MATLSFSRIKKFLGGYACQLEHYWTYEKGRWPPSRSYLVQGSAVHEAIAAYFHHLAEHDDRMPFGRMQQIYRDAFTREGRDAEWDEDEDPDELQRTMSETLEIWHRDRGPLYEVSELRPDGKLPIEWKWFLEMPGYPHDIKGVIDLIADIRKTPGGPIVHRNVIVDWKTSGKGSTQAEIDGDLQVTVYTMACRALLGDLVEGDWEGTCRFEYLVDKGSGLTVEEADDKRGKPWNVRPDEMANWLERYGPNGTSSAKNPPAAPRRIEAYDTERQERHIRWFGSIFGAVCAQIDSGIRIPVPPDHWKCHPDNCDHFAYCRGSVEGTPDTTTA